MTLICKAVVTEGSGNFIIDKIEVNEPKPDEVLVRMKAAGICHTDYDSLAWGKNLILGHEGSGVVVKQGKDVSGTKIGDPVILNWSTPCGSCFQCLEGNHSICENNSPVIAGEKRFNPGQADRGGTTWRERPIERSFNLGTFSEYTLVKSSAVVKNSAKEMSFQAASIISCSVMTGYGSVINAAKVKAGSSVVVIGSGGIGLNVIQGARISGAVKIIAIDINPRRLKMAKRFGADHVIAADKNDRLLLEAAQQVKMLTERGADYAFECTGIPTLGAAPLAMIRNAGTAIQVSGIEEEIKIDMSLFEWDKIYMNPLYGKCRPQRDFQKIIEQYQKGSLLLEEMVSNTYRLGELQNAFDDMLEGRNAKGVIVFD